MAIILIQKLSTGGDSSPNPLPQEVYVTSNYSFTFPVSITISTYSFIHGIVEAFKEDFIQGGYHGRWSVREHCNEVLQCRREIGLRSENSMGKWEFIAGEQE